MTISVKQFSNADELMAHNRRVAALRYAPRPTLGTRPVVVKAPPPPRITVADLISKYVQVKTPLYSDEDTITEIKLQPRLKTIMSAVAEEFGYAVIDVCSTRRHQRLVEARWVFFYLARTMTIKSLPEIARFVSKDHTTVIHGIRSCEKMIEADPKFSARVDLIRLRLQRGV